MNESDMAKLDLGIGWIGVGNMGQAILQRVLQEGVLAREQAVICDRIPERVAAVHAELGVPFVSTLVELVEKIDALLYAAKPQNVADVLPELAEHLRPGQWICSIAAGVKTTAFERVLPEGTPVVRVMPNIAALVGSAASAISAGAHATDTHVQMVRSIFDTVGETLVLDEKLLDVVTGLSGSGPAFIFLVIEALADAGVLMGLSYDEAFLLAQQTTLGAARMALETGEHPAALRNRVTSPGGTTAAGLLALETRGLRAALVEAVKAATERSIELGS